MKLGDLVSYRHEDWMFNDFRKDHYGLGLVTGWDGCGKYKVLWSKIDRIVEHDDWELVPHASR